MITTISKDQLEDDSPTKKEVEINHTRDGLKIINKASSSQSSPWLRLKDPRIVRVSRAFGGKDRHSKVCTIKGLRDRRVRLSVPTAIQLYDLQERLGLNQPSKVVDWLLNVAKHEIDQLPPLPISPINFTFNQLTNSSPQSNKQGFNLINRNWELDHHDEDGGDFWTSNESHLRAKSKQVIIDDHQKENWSKTTENNDEQQGQQLVQMNNNNNNNTLVVPYGSTSSFFHQNFGGGFASENEDHQHDLNNLNAMSLPPSALSLSSSSSGGSHVFVPQPPYPTQMNNFQMFSTQNLFPNSFAQNPYNSMNQSSSDSTTVRGFHFNIGSRLFNSSSEASTTHQAAHDKDQDLD